MLFTTALLHSFTNSQVITGFGARPDSIIQLFSSDETYVGSSTIANRNGEFKIALTAAYVFAASGNHRSFYIRETDSAGQAGTSLTQEVTYDTLPPVITIARSATDGEDGIVHLSGSITASYGADRGTGTIAILDGGRHVGLGEVNTNGTWTATVSVKGSGVHALSAQTADAAGNLGHSSAVNVTVAAPPDVIVSSPPSVTVAPPPDVIVSSQPSVTAVHRFYDTNTGDHFYTTSTAEQQQILKTLPSYSYEGAAWATPEKAANTLDVFRFYDIATNTHFFTADAGERDQILKTLPSYHYEGVAFEAYADAGSAGAGALTLERFYNTQTGLHHYSASAGETYAINHGSAGANWVDEGPAFTVHVPTGDMLHI